MVREARMTAEEAEALYEAAQYGLSHRSHDGKQKAILTRALRKFGEANRITIEEYED